MSVMPDEENLQIRHRNKIGCSNQHENNEVNSKSRFAKFYKRLCKFSFTNAIDSLFFHYGKFVATYPFAVIIVCLLVALFSGIGLIGFKIEERVIKLWIPTDSDIRKVIEWETKNFRNEILFHKGIYQADNVLEKEQILKFLTVHEIFTNTEVNVTDAVPDKNGIFDSATRSVSWNSKCVQIPIVENLLFRRRKRSNLLPNKDATKNSISLLKSEFDLHHVDIHTREKRFIASDFISFFKKNRHCEILENLPTQCLESSVLKIWGYSRELIESLSQEDILNDINHNEQTQMFGKGTTYLDLFAGIERNENGRIIGAKAFTQVWVTSIDLGRIIPGEFLSVFNDGVEFDIDEYRWENEIITRFNKFQNSNPNIDFQFRMSQSFNEVNQNAVDDDSNILSIAYMVIFIYVQLMMGRFNWVEARPLLSLAGILSVVMAFVISNGLCISLGLLNSMVNRSLPFLFLALGIDDMFVIMHAFNNLTREEKSHDLPTRIGYTMKQAGTSILVTSATDITALAVGSLTKLPAMYSYCIFGAVGVFVVFIYQINFFVACLKFDQLRIESKRHCFFPWRKVKNWKPAIDHKDFLPQLFSFIYPRLLNRVSRIFIIGISFMYILISCWGAYNLELRFDPYLLLPKHSYLTKYIHKRNEYFPNRAYVATIFFNNITLHEKLAEIEYIMNKFEDHESIENSNSWYTVFKEYANSRGYDVPNTLMAEEQFSEELGDFLFSFEGFMFQKDFKFESPLNCTDKNPKVVHSRIRYTYPHIYNTVEKRNVYNYVKEVVTNSNISGILPSHSSIHFSWEIELLIEQELYTNLLLAVIAIFVITLLFMSSIVQSFFVLCCVLITLVEVGALMHWWGLTIDIVSCVAIILTVGLCVDFSTHIAHMFMKCRGTREERTVETMWRIGPAVLKAGFSTFLTFIFLCRSESHVFKTFFKVFVGVVVFGLYNGLVFLPVVLSLVGPPSYPEATNTETESKEVKAESIHGITSKKKEINKHGSNDADGSLNVLNIEAGNDVQYIDEDGDH